MDTSDRPQDFPANHLFAALLTFVLWAGCAGVGLCGILGEMPSNTPKNTASKPAPTVAKLIRVELADSPEMPPPQTPNSDTPDVAPPPAMPLPLPAPAPTPVAPTPPNTPALLPVAAPETVVFPLPVEGPTQIVPAEQAAYAAPAAPPAPAAPIGLATPAAPMRLVFGVGDGRQPKPNYPEIAIRRNQTGTVRIRFEVDADGRVTSAEISQPCLYDVLNEAARSAVRHRWRFPKGEIRTYEVDIKFELRS
ncbi:MAG: energy transducer TonB [Puniceicoccales bacterium]|jgi:protein TonB|nr:energy transducer TonB [Puniceicoccales bacterium]